jgi:hypothetical protein
MLVGLFCCYVSRSLLLLCEKVPFGSMRSLSFYTRSLLTLVGTVDHRKLAPHSVFS